MWVDANGKIHHRSRKWYSIRETLDIYAAGGHVVLTLDGIEPLKKVGELGGIPIYEDPSLPDRAWHIVVGPDKS